MAFRAAWDVIAATAGLGLACGLGVGLLLIMGLASDRIPRTRSRPDSSAPVLRSSARGWRALHETTARK